MAKQIESLNVEVAGSLSIEELEERLETQVLRMPEAACDWSCGEVCSGGYGCTTVWHDRRRVQRVPLRRILQGRSGRVATGRA